MSSLLTARASSSVYIAYYQHCFLTLPLMLPLHQHWKKSDHPEMCSVSSSEIAVALSSMSHSLTVTSVTSVILVLVVNKTPRPAWTWRCPPPRQPRPWQAPSTGPQHWHRQRDVWFSVQFLSLLMIEMAKKSSLLPSYSRKYNIVILKCVCWVNIIW